ncbi:hypothetical protein TW84_17850 [Vibrio neptunius]|uniref:hypothetical protein n=1 Tax=Vibrio neptunius TaxID=170651 RepID=UPI0005FA3151|nr:hypothetical protein [Vibrio neptunius]KJY87357.1 hypothetical protein TW84_17850 [Vibrio neptunius]
MRSAINTLLVLLSLMTALLISASSYASSCPIGDTPSLKFPAGTSKVNSACVDGCKAVEGFNGQNTWVCNDSYCTAYYTTTGESCTGEDDTDGSCDDTGNCTPDDNGDGDNTDCGGGVCDYPADIRSLHDAINFAEEGSFNVADKPAIGLKRTQILSVRSGIIGANYTRRLLDKLEQVRSENFSDMDASLGTIKDKTNSIEGKMNSISLNVHNMADDADQSANALNQISNKLDQLIENTKPEEEPDCTPVPPLGLPPPDCIPQPSGVEMKLDGISNTLINNGVNASLTGQEIKSSIDGLSNDLKDIKDALSDDGFEQRDPIGRVDFSENPLYDESKIEAIEKEVEDLEKAYDEKIKQFQSLIGFDESKLNDGKFVNHALNFRLANGVTFTGVSSVLPALVDISYWIANALLFMAVIVGLRQLGN